VTDDKPDGKDLWVVYDANSAADNAAVDDVLPSRHQPEDTSQKYNGNSRVVRNGQAHNDVIRSRPEIASYLLSKNSIDDYFEDSVAAEAADDAQRIARQSIHLL
jgi:hypothetical protein